jgi:hypothetical protein
MDMDIEIKTTNRYEACTGGLIEKLREIYQKLDLYQNWLTGPVLNEDG